MYAYRRSTHKNTHTHGDARKRRHDFNPETTLTLLHKSHSEGERAFVQAHTSASCVARWQPDESYDIPVWTVCWGVWTIIHKSKQISYMNLLCIRWDECVHAVVCMLLRVLVYVHVLVVPVTRTYTHTHTRVFIVGVCGRDREQQDEELVHYRMRAFDVCVEATYYSVMHIYSTWGDSSAFMACAFVISVLGCSCPQCVSVSVRRKLVVHDIWVALESASACNDWIEWCAPSRHNNMAYHRRDKTRQDVTTHVWNIPKNNKCFMIFFIWLFTIWYYN